MSETPVAMMQRLADNTRVGYSFEQEFYTSDAVFQADMDRVVGQKWILAGHSSRIPNKGDYFLFKIGVEQIIIIRENASASAPSSTSAAIAAQLYVRHKAAMRLGWYAHTTLGPSASMAS